MLALSDEFVRKFYYILKSTLFMRYLLLVFLLPMLPVFAESQQLPTDKGTLLVNISMDPEIPVIGEQTKLKIDFVNPKTNSIQEHIDYKVTVTKDDSPVFGPIPTTHTSIGSVTIPVEFKENGEHKITIDVEGILFSPIPLETITFTTMINDVSNGGCLIATATYGTELAPQVQLLRETRDRVLFSTNTGTTFMAGFNSIYYTFSPTISDWERQTPVFKELVKVILTPMLSTLSILNYVEIDAESEMLGYGIGIILLNLAMYFVIPSIIIVKLRKFRTQ
jgi:hypothetical protein